MKKLIYILFIIPLIALGQAPQGVNYQAVAYDNNGFELSNKEVGVRISIIEGSAFGTPQLVEEHDVVTTEQGLFSLIIGQGALLGGEAASLLDIPWGSNTYFLKIELDTENNGSYMDFGTQQFMSVPYALYAETSGTPGPEGPEGEPGNHGLNCWDVNSNGLNDLEEDTNNDGEYNALDCMWVLSNSSSSPLGVILPYAASIAPEGWVICDGTELSRDEYSDLFSLIDTTYGSGNGSTTFNIPNLSGRVPVGIDIDGNTVSNGVELGNFGGEQTHTLLIDEMPNHSHGYTAPINSGNASGQNTIPVGTTSNLTYQETEPIGGDQPHNNMQPYLVTNYIIRVVGEIDPNIDGVNQIPPLEEILELQYKVDSLEGVLSIENNEGYQVYNIENMNDTINVSLKRNKTINLSGSFSLGNPVYQCQCNLEITDLNNVTISSEIIKGFGVTSYSNQYQNYTSILYTPFVAQGSGLYNNSSSFSFQFEVSENLDVKIYISSTCETYSSNITLKH